MELVAGIDLGTSYFKVGLFDYDGIMKGLGRVAVVKDTDDTGRCELLVERFWQLLKTAFADACKQANALPEQVRALGYSSQVNSFILLDKNNTPLTPLILWPDCRPKDVDGAVKKLWQHPDFLTTTGLGMACGPTFCVAKLKWLQKKRPQIYQRVGRIMTISDYLVFGLTEKTSGDAGTASLLGLYDLQHRQWWQTAFDILGLDIKMFSTPLSPGTVAGTITAKGNQLMGLPLDIPLAVGSLDHHIAAVGAGVPSIAPVSESTGTVLACLNYSNAFSPKIDCCMGPGFDSNSYYQLAFSRKSANILEWYQKTYAPQLSIPELLSLAANVPADADGLVALPCAHEYTGLTGFKNVTPNHTHGHFARAILTSNVATLKELIEKLCGNERPPRIVATGGGAKSELWLQIKADMLGTEMVATNCEEPACRGAAMLAAVSLGWYADVKQANACWIKP